MRCRHSNSTPCSRRDRRSSWSSRTVRIRTTDGTDFKADHLIAWAGDEVAGYARIYGPEIKFPEPSIGRILTTQRFRGTGSGREVVARSIARIEQLYPRQNIRIGAQARLERFYNSFGFVTASTEYMEDGIPHIEMVRVAVRPAASHL